MCTIFRARNSTFEALGSLLNVPCCLIVNCVSGSSEGKALVTACCLFTDDESGVRSTLASACRHLYVQRSYSHWKPSHRHPGDHTHTFHLYDTRVIQVNSLVVIHVIMLIDHTRLHVLLHRIPTDLKNLENCWNFVNLETPGGWKSPGIWC